MSYTAYAKDRRKRIWKGIGWTFYGLTIAGAPTVYCIDDFVVDYIPEYSGQNIVAFCVGLFILFIVFLPMLIGIVGRWFKARKLKNQKLEKEIAIQDAILKGELPMPGVPPVYPTMPINSETESK